MQELHFTTAEASEFLRETFGIRIAKSSLDTARFFNRGPRYVRVSRRIYYPLSALLEYARGIPCPMRDSNRGGAIPHESDDPQRESTPTLRQVADVLERAAD